MAPAGTAFRNFTRVLATYTMVKNSHVSTHDPTSMMQEMSGVMNSQWSRDCNVLLTRSVMPPEQMSRTGRMMRMAV